MKVLTVDYTSPSAPALFCQSLKDTGFAVLSNHPIDQALINNAYAQWNDFFQSDKKHDFVFNRETQDGYFPFKSENAKDAKVSDLKEFYHFYPWGMIPDDKKQTSMNMYKALNEMAAELLQWVEMGLPENVAKKLSMPLNQMITESPNTLLRILHYPPLTSEREEGAVRAAAHEDINLITLLPAATAPGLEVKDTKGQWHQVECNPGNIVVNVGDMLQMCTEHYYKSTTHRVTNPDLSANDSRYSMPLFLHPRPDVKLSETHTAQEYLRQRLREIGIY